MASSRPAEQAAESGRAHSAAVVETYRRMLVGSGVTGRRITIRLGVTGYVLAAGEARPYCTCTAATPRRCRICRCSSGPWVCSRSRWTARAWG